MESKFVFIGIKGGFFVVIVEGKCVIIVCVNDVVGVVGFVLLGNLVDVIVNINEDVKSVNNNNNSIFKIVLEKILVLVVV